MRRVLVLLVVGAAMWPAPATSARAMAPGATGPTVAALQQRLAEVGFYRGMLDGEYGPGTAQAVMAFHKHLGLERTFEWQPVDWRYLDQFARPPALPDDQIVVDLDRQLLYLHLDGEVHILPVSSGNGERYRNASGRSVRAVTPTGTFRLYKHYAGAKRSYLGVLWRPWYFRGGYAIHGSPSVPGRPASHGCVRIPNWEADWLASRLWIGMPVSIVRGGEAVPPELPPLPVSRLVPEGPDAWGDGTFTAR